MTTDSETLIQGLGRRYLIVLVIVAALLIVDQAVLQPLMIRLNGFGPVINLAGRQRMLSQRMSKDVLALARDSEHVEPWRTELESSLRAWLAVHRGLQVGDPELRLTGTNRPEILRAFQDLEPHVSAMRKAAEAVLADPAVATQVVEEMLVHERPYLEEMDLIVSRFETEALSQVRMLRLSGAVATAIILCLIIGLAHLVLKPATELIRAQMRRLTASEERFRLLIERMHDGLAVFDLDGRIRYVNRRFSEILCRRPEELLDLTLQRFLSGQDFFRFLQHLSDVRKSPRSVWELTWQVAPDQDCITLAAFGKTHGDTVDEKLGFLVVTDITELKHAERKLRQSHDALEIRVAERTQALTVANQSLAREMADRQAVEARNLHLQSELAHAARVTSLGQFAAGLAHEINQPLGAIANYTEALTLMVEQRPEPDAEIQRMADRIRDSALRAGQIVSRMRSFLKHQSSQRAPERINRLISDVLELCAAESRLNRVNVLCELAETDDAVVLADAIQIQQVLVNLIHNAIQALASCEQDRQLSIRSSSMTDSVQIVLEDNGPGFPAALLGADPLPFRSTKDSGLGLGLSISQSLIAAHQGEFWIENRDSGGARITFTLPVHAVPESSHAANGLCR